MTDLEIAFEETGEQLDRIISALRREKPTPPNPLTKAYWSDNVVTEYNIVGDINYQNFDCWERYPNTLIKVEIGNTVTQIGEHAFEACDSLEEVSIPNSVLNIVGASFADCFGLTIPDSVTSIGGSAFRGCSGLTSITIPDSVTSIGNNMFSGCSGLTSITIPESVTSIGEDAFSSCAGLTSITIPNGVTSIGNEAFYHCSGLTSVTFGNKTKSQVQGMSNYSWDLPSGCVIHCTDGDITI